MNTNTATPPDLSGLALGTLDVGAEIGRGGFGVVHEASIRGINHPFAIKFLDPSPFNAAPRARDRFFREAEILLRLRHPHIISVHGLGEHDGRPYILMERFGGVNLNQARPSGTVTPDSVLPFFVFVADALACAHRNGVVHRDIKPANLLALKGDARVLDFGIAALLDPNGTRLTRQGNTCVGDAFSAPELIDAPRQDDARCDIYSLGACWFWLLTGKTPKGLNWQAALRQAVQVSPDYESVILRCLSQADARYQTMEALISDLEALRSGEVPRAGLDEITDTDALVLGTIASACIGSRETMSLYALEQELAGSIRRFELSMSKRKLEKLGLIAELYEQDWNANDILSIRMLDAGFNYTMENHQHIDNLIRLREQEERREQEELNAIVGKDEDESPF